MIVSTDLFSDITIVLEFSKWTIQLHTSLHFLPTEVVRLLTFMLRGLYTGKILAPDLTSHTIMALLSQTSLKRNITSPYSKNLNFFGRRKMAELSAISRKLPLKSEIDIFSKYLNKILISDNFSFQRHTFCLIYHFNHSKMNGGGGCPTPLTAFLL